FRVGQRVTQVLRGVDVQIYRGDFAVLYGPSGSGKSTLLHALIGLEPVTRGEIQVDRRRIDRMDEDERARFRSTKFGVVYQQPIWVKSLTVVENVAIPLLLAGHDRHVALHRAQIALRLVEMGQFGRNIPTELSGGQQQRASLARALVHDPEILVLDEPTGNLDS